MNLRPTVLSLATLATLAGLGACSVPSPTQWPGLPYVVASMQPTAGNQASGTVYLIQKGPQVLLRGRVTGLKPNQEHGFHVHEKGDCSGADGTTAGGHLNPDAKPHGPPGGEHHAGDLPALTADASGTAEVRATVSGTVLGGGPGDFAGKALVVHASPDDYKTQPAGNSGARIACGVIGTLAGQDGLGRAVPLPIDL
jgi:Cu-Zn family superoxide dismutase